MNKNKPKIDSLCGTIIIWNICAFVIVELLSEIHMLTKNGLIFIWGLVDAVLFGVTIAHGFRKRNKSAWIDFAQRLKDSKQIFTDQILFILVGIFIII